MSRMRAKIGTRETRCHGPWSACSTGPTGPTAAARAPFTGPSFSASAFTDNELRVPFLRGLQIPCSSNGDRKSTRLNSSHLVISYAVFCLKKKKQHVFLIDYNVKLIAELNLHAIKGV